MKYLVEIFCFLIVIGFLFYKWVVKNNKCFSKRNIAHEKPMFLVGNTLTILNGKESLSEMLIRLHKQFKEEKIYGFFGMRNPIFFIRDPELIKKIAIKDFDYFTNHESKGVEALNDDTLSSMLITLQDQKWKDMRTTLSPVFTGNKMRQIFHTISECSCEANKYLKKRIKNNEGTEINLADFFHQYSNDVIASAAFGLKINSFENGDSEFSKMGAAVLKPQGLKVIIMSFILAICPQIGKIFKIFNIKISSPKPLNYLKDVVSHTIRQRQENKIIRQDMIHLMLESQNKGEFTENVKKWTENEMIAQCILFLFAGLGPMTNMLCFTAYELMKNPKIQKNLYEEVAKMNEDLKGADTISYDLLKNMKYLDMVVSETLRMWPSVPILDRCCSKPYTLRDADGKLVADFNAGDIVSFSTNGSHFDEENFENPYTFDPERFSDENKSAIRPFTYFPFGLGPRSCIGNRFALMVGKIMLYQLILEFKFRPSPKSTNDIIAVSRGIQLKQPELFWMNLCERST